MEKKTNCHPEITEMILQKERAALELWNAGNPSGYLDIYAEDFTYFDPMQEKRLDGFTAISDLYESLRGKGKVDKYEIINPEVQLYGDTAILTYNLDSWAQGTLWKWNCTEVYARHPDGEWKIVHNHWSIVQPFKNMEE